VGAESRPGMLAARVTSGFSFGAKACAYLAKEYPDPFADRVRNIGPVTYVRS
jgi:hypothetical protein